MIRAMAPHALPKWLSLLLASLALGTSHSSGSYLPPAESPSLSYPSTLCLAARFFLALSPFIGLLGEREMVFLTMCNVNEWESGRINQRRSLRKSGWKGDGGGERKKSLKEDE